MIFLAVQLCFAQSANELPPATSSNGVSLAAVTASTERTNQIIGFANGASILYFELSSRKVKAISMPGFVSGMVSSGDGTRLFVTCAAAESKVCVVEKASGKVLKTIAAGHTAGAPVLSRDEKTLYVCYPFENAVGVIDLEAGKEIERIPVRREPVAADITQDGRYLLVANHLPAGRSDAGYTAAVVSVISLAAGEVVKEIELPNGSASLRGIRISPDGKFAVVSHVIGRFNRTTSFLRRGWVNVNALSIIETGKLEYYSTALLDDLDQGAANPWAVEWLDEKTVLVTHAGTHEISVIDFPMVLEQLAPLPEPTAKEAKTYAPRRPTKVEAADYLPFLSGSHKRIKLPKGDLGPRGIAVVGRKAYVSNYFSDTVTEIDFFAPEPITKSIALGPKREMDLVRKGEFYFHDASICQQGWQTCASCHPGEGRVDGLNWDLLNDGTENPKNTKSLLLSHQTPPAMSLGVRETAETAVRAGIRHILFTQQPPEVAEAIDAYLKSLKPVPSPYLQKGKLSAAAERGKDVFNRAGCVSCHRPGLYTDLHQYDVGTRGPRDKATDRFDTPTLVEVWRTAPYLHDGSAATVRDVVTTRNPQDQHGKTSNLSAEEINDLCAFVLSL